MLIRRVYGSLRGRVLDREEHICFGGMIMQNRRFRDDIALMGLGLVCLECNQRGGTVWFFSGLLSVLEVDVESI